MPTKFLCWHCTRGGVSVGWRVVGSAGGWGCSIPQDPVTLASSPPRLSACPSLCWGTFCFQTVFSVRGWCWRQEVSLYPPDPSHTTDLVICPCSPKYTEVNTPAVAQNLSDSHPVGSLPLTPSLTRVPEYYNEIRLCILAAVNLLKETQKHSNSFFWYAHFSYSLDRYFQITVKKA